MPQSQRRSDEGSAVAEFTLVSSLLSLVFVSLLQLGLAMHVRNTVVDSAIAGARIAAAADRTPEDGAAHTADLIGAAVSESYARDVTVSEGSGPSGRMLTVTVRIPVPVLGLLGPVGSWELTGRALAEDPQL